ncbi:MAG: Zn-dependent hydrolase [Bacteroidota bacterium]
MNQLKILFGLMFIVIIFLISCKQNEEEPVVEQIVVEKTEMENNVDQYASFKLTTDLSILTEKEKQMLPLLFEAAQVMDKIYKMEAYFGDYNALHDTISDEATKKFFDINYGPWERLDGNKSFIKGVGEKPLGSGFYPPDMTKEEFETFSNPEKANLYTIIRRSVVDGLETGQLVSYFYNDYFKEDIAKASELVVKASELAEDPGLKKYLQLRAKALLTDDYRASDIAWLEMKDNTIDFVIGPIETYEDALFGYKAAHESFILVKDKEWSKKLEKFNGFLPKLQTMLPCEQKYKNETPGSSGNELNAYDVLYYAGDCNAGSKTIAINLPNDEYVREKVGSRKLQLKNSMQAKFDKILVPIANLVIDESQRKYLSFDAFFTNTMFHEVGHGLGLSYTINNKKISVRDALKDSYTSIEEGKADILGLYIVDQLYEMGELGQVDLMNYYVTFMAGIFRSSRFGVASAHGKANMMRFYFFEEKGAFIKNAETGLYTVDFEKMRASMKLLAEKILIIQGDGDYDAAVEWIEKDGIVKPDFQKDLDKINAAGIPVDIVFEQGLKVLGL